LQTGFEINEIEFWRVGKRFQLHEGRTLREFVPALLRARGWSDAFYALRDVTFSVARGETVAIIGPNGSGKSTILKLIAGVMAPTEGELRVAGRVSPLIELGAGFHPDLTGRENVFLNACILGMSGKEARDRFDEIVSFAELWDFIDTPVKRYSSGMYARLGFSVAVHSDPDLLLVDEVLSVGDAAFEEKCLAKMHDFQARGTTIVVVSHSMSLVRKFCQRVLLVEGGCLVAEGDPEEVIERYLERVTPQVEMASSGPPTGTSRSAR
jgi:ABC-type polysaccharide/polyol phosphate transport system ATPase subunit